MMLRRSTALLAVLLLGLTGCVDGDAPATVTALFALEAPEAAEGAGPLRDEHGIFDLQSYPAYIALTVTASDMDRVAVTWPGSEEEYAAGEQTIELPLDVPAGEGRTVQMAIFMFHQDQARCFTEAEETVVDLEPGSTQDLQLDPIGTGSAWATGVAQEGVEEVWLVDSQTSVRLDRTYVDGAGSFSFYGCAGRKLTLAWLDGDGFHFNPLDTFTLVPGENRNDLTIP